MSLKPIALKGFKRTPYIDATSVVSTQIFSGWAQILYEHFLREYIEKPESLFAVFSFPPSSQSIDLKEYLKKSKNNDLLSLGNFDGLEFWGLEALLYAWGVLQTQNLKEVLVVGGQAFTHEEKLLFQKRELADPRLVRQGELVAREEGFERDFLDNEKVNQSLLARKVSSQGTYAHELLSIFVGEGVRKLIKTDQLSQKNIGTNELKSFPALIDHLRGVVTDGNMPNISSALAMAHLSVDSGKSDDLVLSDYFLSMNTSSCGLSSFLTQALTKWEQDHFALCEYTRIEFVELSTPHSIAVRKVLESKGVSSSKLNPWGGALGKGFCSPIEGLTSLGHMTSLKSKEKGLLIAPHASGHVLLIEVSKS